MANAVMVMYREQKVGRGGWLTLRQAARGRYLPGFLWGMCLGDVDLDCHRERGGVLDGQRQQADDSQQDSESSRAHERVLIDPAAAHCREAMYRPRSSGVC